MAVGKSGSTRELCSNRRKRTPLESMPVNFVDIREFQKQDPVLPTTKPFRFEDLNGTAMYSTFLIEPYAHTL